METAQAADTIAPVAGQYYITRDGTLVGPMLDNSSRFYPFKALVPGERVLCTWQSDGRYFKMAEAHKYDLVALHDAEALERRARDVLDSIATRYYAVGYEHIDDTCAFRPLTEAFDGDAHPIDVDNLRNALGSLFKDAGWEGDGEIECFFIPPCFVAPDQADDYSVTLYHVKQSNNGTSYIALPRGMTFRTPVRNIAGAAD
jgi:hypothetical protein